MELGADSSAAQTLHHPGGAGWCVLAACLCPALQPKQGASRSASAVLRPPSSVLRAPHFSAPYAWRPRGARRADEALAPNTEWFLKVSDSQ